MKILILIILLIGNAWADSKHPIYKQILRNEPRINKKYAMRLSNVIHKACLKYNVPKHIYTAILMQESRYKLHALRKVTGLLNGEETTIKTDFGIAQVHWKNVKNMKLDIDLLLNDLVYSVNQGAKILAYFKKRYAKKEEKWWSRYNASSKVKRNIYEKLVERYL